MRTITLRIGAAYDELIVNGEHYDRSVLDKKQRKAMADLLIENLFSPQQRKKSRKRSKKK